MHVPLTIMTFHQIEAMTGAFDSTNGNITMSLLVG